MRVLLQLALCALLAGGTAVAQRGGHGGGGGGGGMRGGFGGGGMRGGFGGGGMRGGFGGGGMRGGFGGGGMRGGFGGGFRGGFGHGGFHNGFNRGFRNFGFKGFGFRGFGRGFNNFGFFGGFPSVWASPFIGSYGYWPYFGDSYDYGYDPYAYSYPYASSYPYGDYGNQAYNPSPNVTVIYPQTAQTEAAAPYAERAHPVLREYDQYGQEIQPSAPAAGTASSPVYLFAFKDNVIRAADAYWVEGQTLHYVTPDHQERQVPLADVDRSLTLRLNHERHVTINLTQ